MATYWVCVILELIIVVVDVRSVSVRRGVTGANGGVLIVVMLPPLVIGTRVVHPVLQVRLQPLEMRKHRRHVWKLTNLRLKNQQPIRLTAATNESQTLKRPIIWQLWPFKEAAVKWHMLKVSCRVTSEKSCSNLCHQMLILFSASRCSLPSSFLSSVSVRQEKTWRSSNLALDVDLNVCERQNHVFSFTTYLLFKHPSNVWGYMCLYRSI